MPSDAERARWEKRIAEVVQRVEAKTLRELITLLGDPPNVARVPASFWTRMGLDYAEALRAPLESLYIVAARELAARGGEAIEVDWALANTRAATWASSYCFSLVSGMEANLKGRLQEIVSAFFAQPATVGELTGQLEQVLPDWQDRLGRVWGSAERAEMVATTEVTRTVDQSTNDLANQITRDNPAITFIETWETSQDEIVRRCPVCWPLQGAQPVSAGGEFVHPATRARYRPPAHPRCRCRVIRRMVVRTKQGTAAGAQAA